MALKTLLNYSPNFDSKKRNSKQIKFIIFHYTGMQKESAAINRLTNIQSEVSCHYLIKNNGEIIKIVPDLFIAWHAGKSSWKNYKSLNQNSIGIEITNPGHEFGYKKFSKKQILTLLKLSKFLIKNRGLKTSKIEKKFFFNNLFKIGYSKKTPKDLNKDRYLRDVAKAFQRRFRQELINGKIDRECLLINENLLKRYY